MKKEDIIAALRRFKEVNREKYQILTIGIFGSVARNEMRDGSDIDVVVDIAEPDLFTLIAIKRDLEEQLRQSVDIVRYREDMPPFFKQRIDQEAVYV